MINNNLMQYRCYADRQKGLAIITVMLVVALMVVLLSFLTERQHLLIRRIANQNVAEKGYQYALGVSAWGQRVLHEDQNRAVDYLDEDWAKFGREPEIGDDEYQEFSLDSSLQEDEPELPTVDFGSDVELEYKIIDLQSRYNLNNLANTGDDITREQKLIFLNLLTVAGIEESDTRVKLYNALRDWLDEDSSSVGEATESPHYGSKDVSYYAADQRLVSLAELSFVEGYTKEIINQLRPHVTVLPVDYARLNINTASADVLSSLSPNPVVDTAPVVAYLAQREDIDFQGFQVVTDAETAIIGVSPLRNQPIKNMMQTNSQYFQLTTKVLLGDYEFCMRSLLLRENVDPENTASSGNAVRVIGRQHDKSALCDDDHANGVSDSSLDEVDVENVFDET